MHFTFTIELNFLYCVLPLYTIYVLTYVEKLDMSIINYYGDRVNANFYIWCKVQLNI